MKKLTGEDLAEALRKEFDQDYFEGIDLVRWLQPLPKEETANPDHAVVYSALERVAQRLNRLLTSRKVV